MQIQISGRRLPPSDGRQPKKLVILLHGYGGSGDGMISFALSLAPLLPDTLFISPNAPTPRPNDFGYQWFPMTNLDAEVLRQGRAKANALYDSWREGCTQAAPIVRALIDSELKNNCIAPENLAIIGMSQGAMLATHVALPNL